MKIKNKINPTKTSNFKAIITTTFKILAPLVAAIPLLVIPIHQCNQEIRAEELKKNVRFIGLEDYMLKTKKGVPITADISKPIKIRAINASEQDKRDIEQALNEITEICPDIRYTLLSNDNYIVEQDITIHSDVMLDAENYGTCSLTYNQNTAKLQYPITIEMSANLDNIYSSTDDSTLYSYVLKHELMHTLGFCDLYEDKYFNETIMYYQALSNSDITTFTDKDENNIRQLYSNSKVAKVYRPTKIQFNMPLKKEEQPELDI